MTIRKVILHISTQIGSVRTTNEDAHSYNLNLKTDGSPTDGKRAPIDFFAICDGHGGDTVSKFIIPYLWSFYFKDNITYPISNEILNKYYDIINNKVRTHLGVKAAECGSTALVGVRYVLGDKEYFQIVNVGDCRGVMCTKDNFAIPMTKDHKPGCPDEIARIIQVCNEQRVPNPIASDGYEPRVLDLSVSRNFGDFAETPFVTHRPESFVYELKGDEKFIIMACDGLWESLENCEAVNFVINCLEKRDDNMFTINGKYPTNETIRSPSIAKKLAMYAIAKGSTDNVSVMVILFE